MGQKYTPPAGTSAPRKAYDHYVDPTVPTIEELRQQAEAEKVEAVKGREEWAVNKEIAKVGEWETVEAPPPPPVSTQPQEDVKDIKLTTSGPHHDIPDDDEDEEDLHAFKIKEKELEIPMDDNNDKGEDISFKKRKLGESSSFKSRKKKPLRKKD